jgi:hypothetical protein
MSDPIIEEVRRTRKEIEAEHNNDWKALERFFNDKQKIAPGRKAVYKPRRLRAIAARKATRAKGKT